MAKSLGFTVLDPATQDVAATVEDRTAGAGVDIAFEVSGTERGMHSATWSLRVGGRLVVVAIFPTPTPIDLHRVFWRELELVGARVYDRSDFARALQLLADGDIAASALISRVEPLARINEAFAALDDTDSNAVKILLDLRARP